MKQSEEDKLQLRNLAKTLADEACKKINLLVQFVDTPTISYKNQWILEELISILKERV